MTIALPRNLSTYLSGINDWLTLSQAVVRANEVYELGGVKSPPHLASFKLKPDCSFIIGVWCTLIAIMFTFNLVSSEVNSKTVQLTLTYGVSRWEFVATKLAATITAIFMPVWCLMNVSLFIIIGTTSAFVNWSEIFTQLLVLNLTMVSALLLIAFYSVVGTLLSVSIKSEQASLITSISLWLFMVSLWPTCAFIAALEAAPLESIREASSQWSTLENGVGFSLSVDRLKTIVDQPWSDSTKREKIVQMSNGISAELESKITSSRKAAKDLRSEYRRKQERQISLAIFLASVFPSGQWRVVLEQMSLSGYARHKELSKQLELFSSDFAIISAELKGEHSSEAHFRSSGSSGYKGFRLSIAYDKDFSRVGFDRTRLPVFNFVRPEPLELFSRTVDMHIFLLTYLIVTFLLLYVISMRARFY
jgi:ABC-type transport system involved in multi-copper enzyme maturation permease subunit